MCLGEGNRIAHFTEVESSNMSAGMEPHYQCCSLSILMQKVYLTSSF